MITKGQYKNMSAYVLESQALLVRILPDFGGKIASILDKKSGYEVLAQPIQGEYMQPGYGADFCAHDPSGIDEMFPTIDACTYGKGKYAGKALPDHGEIWSLPWRMNVENTALRGIVHGVNFPYEFRREITLVDATLHMSYEILNQGDTELYGLWALHPLFRADAESRVILNGIDRVVNVHESEYLGAIGALHSYPITKDLRGSVYHVDRINDLKKTEKIYIDRDSRIDEAGIILNNGKLFCRMIFSSKTLPYLGIWYNEGGFNDAYMIAIEPSNGFYDAVSIADRENGLAALPPGESLRFFVDMAFENI